MIDAEDLQITDTNFVREQGGSQDEKVRKIDSDGENGNTVYKIIFKVKK